MPRKQSHPVPLIAVGVKLGGSESVTFTIPTVGPLPTLLAVMVYVAPLCPWVKLPLCVLLIVRSGGEQVLSRIETLAEPLLATARSPFPSPLKSPMATEYGLVPAVRLTAAANVPSPFPERIETLLLPEFVTARSLFPSPLKSPVAIETGLVPAG